MIVRRFVNWLKERRLAATTELQHRSRAREREPVLSGRTISNWLDNGRRLRPDVARNTTHTDISATRVEVSYQTSLSAAEEALAVSQPCETTVKSQSGGAGETGAFSSPPVVAEPSSASLEGIEQLDAEQRGLVYLKYLVRHGVYNEGYPTQELPAQYRHSAGLDGVDESHDERN